MPLTLLGWIVVIFTGICVMLGVINWWFRRGDAHVRHSVRKIQAQSTADSMEKWLDTTNENDKQEPPTAQNG